jgi:hypothetical protein
MGFWMLWKILRKVLAIKSQRKVQQTTLDDLHFPES